MFDIKKGLNIPIDGVPEPVISCGPTVPVVALIGGDYIDMKPTMLVGVGDYVKLGQGLFTDKKNPSVTFTAPGCGRVVAIERGQRRRFLAMQIELDGDATEAFAARDVGRLTRGQVLEDLLASGLWTALRTRPYDKVPRPETRPHSIFVTAIDTNPLSVDPAVVIAERAEEFAFGLLALTQLTEGPVYLCHEAGKDLPGGDVPRVSPQAFTGPHPAGLPGTHIHFLDPVGQDRTVWHIGYQDVISYGFLIARGQLNVERVVALAGPSVLKPRWLRTRIGARLDELVDGELKEGEQRIISGSVLAGRTAAPPENFLGRYDNQICVIEEGRRREFLGWGMPGLNKLSATRGFASAWFGGNRRLPLNSSLGGSRRAMVPIGVYEKVMPLDILPTQLLRALLVGDTEQAQALGCLELAEEDVALCTFVCPSKYDYGLFLRENLSKIEEEG